MGRVTVGGQERDVGAVRGIMERGSLQRKQKTMTMLGGKGNVLGNSSSTRHKVFGGGFPEA